MRWVTSSPPMTCPPMMRWRFFFDDELDFDGFGAWEIVCFGFAAYGSSDDFDAVACCCGFG